MAMDNQGSGILTLDLLSGAATGHPSQGSRQAFDLNLPPATDLQLGLPAQQHTAVFRQFNCGSVLTLDKVRSALERFERGCKKGRSTAGGCSNTTTTPMSTISSSSGVKLSGSDERADGESYESSSVIDTSSMVLAGCPRCLAYVLISKGNPSCPRCWSHVPVLIL